MAESESDRADHAPEDGFITDGRGIRIADGDYDCPECGDAGLEMHRPGSKTTCAHCFHVENGRHNDYTFEDMGLTYREAQQLLAHDRHNWHGTPGTVASRIRARYESVEQAARRHETVVNV